MKQYVQVWDKPLPLYNYNLSWKDVILECRMVMRHGSSVTQESQDQSKSR